METLEFPITQWQANRRRRSVVVLTVAFVASVLLHGLLFYAWPAFNGLDPAPAPESLELTLVAPPAPAFRKGDVTEPDPPPKAPQSEAVKPQTPATAIDERPVTAASDAPEVSSDSELVLPEPLDLTLPPGWVAEQEEALQAPADDLLPFNPELSRALAQARERQARSALLAARRGAVAGLDAAAFGTRRDALGETVKVDDACFALRQDALDAGAPRWWRVRCGDVRENAFLRPASESDAVGRIVAD